VPDGTRFALPNPDDRHDRFPWTRTMPRNTDDLHGNAPDTCAAALLLIDVPVIYANDNFGRWRSDFRAQVDYCTRAESRGRSVVEKLKPGENDYFVLKPKHSAFYHTTLELLLKHLGTRTVVCTGLAGNICVLFTASDAYLRDLKVVVPADCVASNTEEENHAALDLMKKLLKADVRPSGAWTFEELMADTK